MSVVEKFIAGFFLVAVFIVVFRDGGKAANNILTGIGNLNAKTFGSLQGFPVVG